VFGGGASQPFGGTDFRSNFEKKGNEFRELENPELLSALDRLE